MVGRDFDEDISLIEVILPDRIEFFEKLKFLRFFSLNKFFCESSNVFLTQKIFHHVFFDL